MPDVQSEGQLRPYAQPYAGTLIPQHLLALGPLGKLQHRSDWDANGNLIYEGWAVPGAASSAAAWSIRKYAYSDALINGAYLEVLSQAAGGDDSFVNVWDDRATSVSYS